MTVPSVGEAIGYIASILIVVSVTRTSILKLRLYGLVGSITFLAYGVSLGAWPIVVTNLVIVVIHLAFLSRLRSKTHEFFRTLEVDPDSRYMFDFLKFYADEIKRFQPEFEYKPTEDQVRVFILRDMIPAGLLIGNRCRDHSFEVSLDFVIPHYRDFQVARFLYSSRSGVFRDPECRTIWSQPGEEAHRAYLERIGFVSSKREDGAEVMTRSID